MNITPMYLEQQLRNKGRQMSLHILMIEAQQRVLALRLTQLKLQRDQNLTLQQYTLAKAADSQVDKFDKQIVSLDKVLYRIKQERRMIGLSIQQLISFQGLSRKGQADENDFAKVKDKIILQLSRTFEYRFRHYEFWS